MSARKLQLLTLMLSCFQLASCAQTVTVDTACAYLPQGTAHMDDTPTTKRWMISYEIVRQEKCFK